MHTIARHTLQHSAFALPHGNLFKLSPGESAKIFRKKKKRAVFNKLEFGRIVKSL